MASFKKGGYDHLLKLIIIGDSSVGKTCLLLRFSEDSFPLSHMPTIGIDFKIKTINVDDQKVKLQVWDTAGQERFRTITQTYYKGAMGIILVYDCTEEQSFANVKNWLKQIDQHAQSNVKKVLVANKCDKPDKAVESERGKELAASYGLDFFESSAKTGENVAEVFDYIARQIIDQKVKDNGGVMPPSANSQTRNNPAQPSRISLGGQEKKLQEAQSSGCC